MTKEDKSNPVETESAQNENVQDSEHKQVEALTESVDVIPEVEKEKAPSAESLKNEILYLRAEFDNFKKRMARDQEAAIRYANERLIAELVPLLSLFDKAMACAGQIKEKSENLSHFVTGIEMTQKEFINVLGRFGVEFIGSVGENFDPLRHEAISQQEVDDKLVGKVVTVLEKGCTLHGRLLIPARVVVGKNSPK